MQLAILVLYTESYISQMTWGLVYKTLSTLKFAIMVRIGTKATVGEILLPENQILCNVNHVILPTIADSQTVA